MNQRELGELRRRWRPDKCAVSRIYGCFVNNAKNLVLDLDESLGTLPQEEAELYLDLLKKALSGTLGKNLIDIVFSTRQVADGSEEHRLLSTLRSSGLQDSEARHAFYEKVMASLDMGEDNYLLLLAHDTYDVPHRGRDGEVQEDRSEEVFSYLLCCVCPVKPVKGALGYFPGDNEFHCTAGQSVAAPELGFLFPAFDGRRANIYNALFYSRRPDQLHQEFIDAVFRTEPPMSAGEQRESFQEALTESLAENCSVDLVQSLHERLAEKIAAHKESHNPEPLTVSVGEVASILTEGGVSQAQVESFRDQCRDRFGPGAVLNPANLIDTGKFEVRTSSAAVSVDPACSYLLETRIIDGKKYLLVPAEEDVQVNGLPVRFSAEGREAED